MGSIGKVKVIKSLIDKFKSLSLMRKIAIICAIVIFSLMLLKIACNGKYKEEKIVEKEQNIINVSGPIYSINGYAFDIGLVKDCEICEDDYYYKHILIRYIDGSELHVYIDENTEPAMIDIFKDIIAKWAEYRSTHDLPEIRIED